jgi:hypothetical protein
MHRPQKEGYSSAVALFKSLCLICLLSLTTAGGMVGQKHVRQAFAVENPPGVAVEISSRYDATIYSITEIDCTITWAAYTTELNKGVVKHAARCPATLSQQLPSLTRILEEFLGKDRNAPSLHTLFWGGLVPETGSASLEMPLRLALAAYRSPGWDVKRGRPTSGDMNRFVKDLANREPIYPELRALFKRFHRSISIASVEKVRVLEAGKLPFSDELKKQGVQAADKLPFDCMVWFALSEEMQ